MQNNLVLYITTVVCFLGVDMIWLRLIAKNFYAEQLGPLLREKPILASALVFYVLYPIGMMIFGIMRAPDAGSLRSVFVSGALFGFFAYLTYDATNYAVMKDFPLKIAVVDTLWGALASGTTCVIVVWLLGRFGVRFG
jgi:uncharacterized membrane protein